MRKNIYQPPTWWAAFEKAATAEGKTLSEWIGEKCKASLTEAAQAELENRRPANRPLSLESSIRASLDEIVKKVIDHQNKKAEKGKK